MDRSLKNIVFWESIISPHLAYFINEVQSLLPQVRIYYIVEQALSEERKLLKWEIPILHPSIELVKVTDNMVINSFIDLEDCVHILEGIKATKIGFAALNKLISAKNPNIYVMSEVPDLRGKRKLLRKLYGFIVEYKYKNFIRGVFTIGYATKDWYRSFGYLDEKLHDFYYTVKKYHGDSLDQLSMSCSKVKFVFVGSLIQLKGVDRLLASLANLATRDNWTLDLYGDGDMKKELLYFCERNDLQNSVQFMGIVENSRVITLLKGYDYLVLPSYYDGWGAVVNEALQCGTKVIVSNSVGSNQLLQSHKELGYIFKNEVELNGILSTIIDGGLFTTEETRRYIEKWYLTNLSPEIVAQNFVDVITF